MNTIVNLLVKATENTLFRLVIIAVVMDTIFGVMRAIKEHKFNSSFGIDGAIRKLAMLFSLICAICIDALVKLNLIGFIPEAARNTIGLDRVGVTEFFSILYLCYEAVSILKNMALCGLPVKKVWQAVTKFLSKYTNELPSVTTDTEAEEGKTAAEAEEENQTAKEADEEAEDAEDIENE